MADDCFAGFAILPIIMVVFFISILSRAMRAGAGGSSYSYGGRRQYRYYGNSFYALQYLAQQAAYRPYQQQGYQGYSPPYSPPSSYRTGPGYSAPYQQPYQPSYSSGGYGSGFGSVPPPAYSTGQAGGPAPAPPAPGPAPEVPKVSCSYCGSLNPNTEQNCLLCGAPMK